MIRLLLLLAYIPSAGSLLRHAAERAGALGRTREVTLTGTLSVRGEEDRNARLVLRMPLSCKLQGDGGLALSVKGARGQTQATAEGTTGPALQLLQLACPLLAYRGLSAAEASEELRSSALAAGADVTAGSALSRLFDRVVYVLGAGAHDLTRPQLWLYKDDAAPARLIAQGGLDLRLLDYGNPAAGSYFPRVIELWQSGQLLARFSALEAHGVRGAPGEVEEDDSRE